VQLLSAFTVVGVTFDDIYSLLMDADNFYSRVTTIKCLAQV